jgi:hypothetical protein
MKVDIKPQENQGFQSYFGTDDECANVENGHCIAEKRQKYDESTMKVDIKSQGNQGFQGSFGTGVCTDIGNGHNIAENMGKVAESMIKIAESMMKVDIKPQGNQGFRGNSGTGTYTNTYTDTYNKSHKSEERESFQKIHQEGDDQTRCALPVSIGAVLNKARQTDELPVVQNRTVQDMFKIWQEEFPDSDERLSSRSASWLKAAYDASFNEDLRAWRNYLRKAKTSEFIMDRPHLLCLKWLLSFETIGNISRGAYDVTEPELDMAEVAAQQNALNAELMRQIETLDEAEICKKQRLKILSKIGPFAYRAWFVNVSMELDDYKKFRFHGSRFVVDCIKNRYSELIEPESERPTQTENIVNFQALRRQNSGV